MKKMNKNWILKLQHFCERYNLEFQNLAEILNDPKVIPMIRGKSFEFSVKNRLEKVLDQHLFEIIKPYMNVQIGSYDIDVQIKNRSTGKTYVVECKLAAKRSFVFDEHKPFLKVKCMKSRTLGTRAAEQKSKVSGKTIEELMIHNDQYLPGNFDLIITSIANSFYDTNDEGLFYWNPSQNDFDFLGKLEIITQQQAFDKMYVAKSIDLVANEKNSVICTRRQCHNKNCGFIPNYPIIKFDSDGYSQKPWVPIEKIATLLD